MEQKLYDHMQKFHNLKRRNKVCKHLLQKAFAKQNYITTSIIQTKRKVLKVAKIKDADYGCKDEGNDDGVSHQSVVSQVVMLCVMEYGGVHDGVCDVVDGSVSIDEGSHEVE